MSSGISNTVQAWDKGVRSFVKVVFNASQKNPQTNKSTTNPAKKEKDPTLL